MSTAILELKRDGRIWHRNRARWYPEAWSTESGVFDFLYGFARMIKPERVLEIGTFEGDTAVAMGRALRDNGKGILLTTDIKDYKQEETVKEAGLSEIITCIKSQPNEALASISQPFDMVFIDDGHSYPEVTRDLETAHRLTKAKSYILGHDVLMISDVSKAYNEFINRYKDQYERLVVDSYDGVFVLRKRYD